MKKFRVPQGVGPTPHSGPTIGVTKKLKFSFLRKCKNGNHFYRQMNNFWKKKNFLWKKISLEKKSKKLGNFEIWSPIVGPSVGPTPTACWTLKKLKVTEETVQYQICRYDKQQLNHTAPYGVKSGHMLLGPKMIADTSKMVPEDAHHQKQQVFRKKLYFQNFHQQNILHRVPPMKIVKNPWKLACFGLRPSAPRCRDLKLLLTGA